MSDMEKPYIIAGPCSVESREQLLHVTEQLCKIPRVHLIRGGVWKPRTRPGGFEGLGEPALGWMKEIADSDLRMADGQRVRFCCEVARPEHVQLCLKYGIGTVWIGARTTANPFMVEEICSALRGTQMDVMVKNPMNPDVHLWLGAIERVRQAGIAHISAVHRGFSTYQPSTFRNNPLWELSLELKRQLPDIPLLCDPSHIGGRRDLIPMLVQSAMLLDYDGLMIEVHPTPDTAWTDKSQQITPEALADLLAQLATYRTSINSPRLELMRKQIDEIDREVLQLLAHRMQLARQIAGEKKQLHMTIFQPQRWETVLDDRLRQAEAAGLNPAFVQELMEKIHGESVRVQME